MTNIFDGEKYKEASLKAIEFIKRQLNVNNYSLFPKLAEDYDSGYTGRIIAKVDMPPDAKINFPSYIYCDQFYDEKYQGVVSGKHKNITDARKNLAVEVTTYTDQQYRSALCFLHADGTWKSEVYYRETDYYGVGDLITCSETYWYRQDVIINENGSNGIKGFTLKYYKWVDDTGEEVDPDNLPGTIKEIINPVPIDPDTGEPMLHRLKEDQNADGSWNFSYDIYIGKLFHDYVRTGAIGWVVWGICYAILQMGTFCDEKHGFKKMLMKAGEWILSRQVTDTKDPRYGLLRGGYGAYDSEYRYSDVEIEWCSTEHQCSTLQALEGLSLVLNDKKYKEAAELVRDQLFLKCYDESNGRFYQGINGGKPDKAWALDCTTWAGSLIFSVVHTDTAKRCFHTARDVYLTENKQIVKNSDKEHYNMKYSSPELFAGFKPYSDKTPDYEGAPDIVWTEGTLGYAALALCVGEEEEAKKYVDECVALQNCEGCTGGVIYVTETYASLPWEFHVWESVVSSAWLYLIINNPDVLFPRTLRQVYYMVKTYNIKDERP